MASITIRNLDETLKQRLRVRAAEHNHSMEEEVREILQQTLVSAPRESGLDLFERIRARFAPLGGVALEIPAREPVSDPPDFGEEP